MDICEIGGAVYILSREMRLLHISLLSMRGVVGVVKWNADTLPGAMAMRGHPGCGTVGSDHGVECTIWNYLSVGLSRLQYVLDLQPEFWI